MIGIDTNILVRFFTQDDRAQGRKATAFIQSLTASELGYVSLVVLVEMVWVLRSSYRLSRPQLAAILTRLLDSPEIIVEDDSVVREAVLRFQRSRVEFVDQLIERCSHAAGCTATVTFDVDASRATGMRLL
ncbi:MAG TPA: type II toxin-antitoxin system VapC family toxin [Terracidiphilus sp.]|jgi:predicted nucleic-acid-binding protein|nr:type II toxin-antitoxin system VapC family toxin [Terracidiphilus sp.]